MIASPLPLRFGSPNVAAAFTGRSIAETAVARRPRHELHGRHCPMGRAASWLYFCFTLASSRRRATAMGRFILSDSMVARAVGVSPTNQPSSDNWK